MRLNLTALIAAALIVVPVASAGHPPARHGTAVVSMRVCGAPVSASRQLVNADLTSIGGRIGSRELRYWNESPSTSYLYGVNTFVRISLSRHILAFRAVRLVPVCASLRLSYSW